jgi:ABC-type transport system involved in multi-copper enzyme maturation permease subunit
MKTTGVVLWVEILKIRKAKIFLATVLVFMFVPLMMGLIMFVQINPGVSEKLGMIGSKATMLRFGEPCWQNYFTFLIQGFAAIGVIGIGFVASWVFGREFSEHTIKDILVLPVSRTYIVISKFIVVVIWSFLLSMIYFTISLIAGLIIDIPLWSDELVLFNFYKFSITSLLTILLSTPVALLASYSRGYMLPMGFVILTLIIANFTGIVGLGPYFPWAIPGLYGTASGAVGFRLNLASYIILISTAILGFSGTLAIWRSADQK